MNRKGIDFYRRLVEGMLERGISPLATLYHWDLPQRLQDDGGWASREIVDRFVDYAGLVFDGLGDLVDTWITHNEPWVTSFLGYGYGVKAPGVADWSQALAAAHHALLSHGRAVHAFRAGGGRGEIGITLDLTHVTGEPEAARRLDGHRNRWFLDPVLRGGYPGGPGRALRGAHRAARVRRFPATSRRSLRRSTSSGSTSTSRPSVRPSSADGPLAIEQVPWDGPRTAMGWTVEPSSLTALLLRLKRDYGDVPLVITENGASYDDPPLDGQAVIEDPQRVAFLRGHVEAVERAVEAGVDVRGYYVWSLLDNFEWEHGYDRRFGIVAVNFENLKRTPKRSALWYRDLIARHSEGS